MKKIILMIVLACVQVAIAEVQTLEELNRSFPFVTEPDFSETLLTMEIERSCR